MRSRRTAEDRLLSSRTVRFSRGEDATVASTRLASPRCPGARCGLAAGYALRYWLTTSADAAATAASSTRSAGWSAAVAPGSAGCGRSSSRSPARSYPELPRAAMSSSA